MKFVPTYAKVQLHQLSIPVLQYDTQRFLINLFFSKTPIQENVNTFQKESYLTQENGTIACKYYYQHHNKVGTTICTVKYSKIAQFTF